MAEPTTRRHLNLSILACEYVRARTAAGTFSPATAPNVRSMLLALAAGIGDVPPDKVFRRDIERYLHRPGLAPGTRRNRLSHIRVFWEWLALEGHATANPTVGIAKFRQPRGLPRGLRHDQAAAVLAAASRDGRVATSTTNPARGQLVDSRSRLIVTWMLQLGVRSVELSRLRCDDIDFGERSAVVVGKGGHERKLPITEEAWEALEHHLAATGITSGFVLRSLKKNGQLSEKPLTPNWIHRQVGGLMRSAGLNESGHSLRHTAASDALKAGAHLVDVQAMLGHVHVGITSRYLPLEVDGLRKAMEGRRYTEPVSGRPAAGGSVRPDLDAIPALIDTVAALTATVRELQLRLADQPAGVSPGGGLDEVEPS